MSFDSWDKDEAGRLKVWPLQAFTTAIFDGKAGGVRFEVGKAKAPGLPLPAVQITLDADQLRELAQALVDVADRIDPPGAPSGPKN